ncbi:dienelactone hydrolase family protein [Frankia sp. AiPa1]|uniref:alpha/beta hydrolase family protein n=1 Tax=Frankia sp. AiPa1 TaxID=573492 RepID=UPI00202B439E|nr:dienelactone hydrolase family protein [Frankia sp. AiPa1]MCL9759402.1 dienelactone hydrolase family protein [Frankia sp. AiPa1]
MTGLRLVASVGAAVLIAATLLNVVQAGGDDVDARAGTPVAKPATAAAQGPAAAPVEEPPAGSASGPEEESAILSDPGGPGSWAVGYRTVRLVDPRRAGRVLITSLWYPARQSTPALDVLPHTVVLPRTVGRSSGEGAVQSLPLVSTARSTVRVASLPDAFASPPARTEPGSSSVRLPRPDRPAAIRATTLNRVTRANTANTANTVDGANGAGVGTPEVAWSAAGGSCPVAPSDVAPGAAGQPAFYPVVGQVGLVSDRAVTDAPPARGPFPLVIFSHGSAGSRVQTATLLEGLASHGYIVAAPDHTGDTLVDAAENRSVAQIPMAVDRSRDLTAVLDALTGRTCQVRRLVQLDRIASVGFSFGGLTSTVSSVGLLGASADPRIRASVGLSAATAPLPAAILNAIRVPTLELGGTRDISIPLGPNAERAFAQLTSSHPRVLVTVAGDTHNSFSDVCRQAHLANDPRVPAEVALRLTLTAAVTCSPPNIDPARAELLVQRATVAFLGWQLRGQTAYRTFLIDQALGDPGTVTARTQP